jgi:carotenoid 1,2-hydratase
MPHAFRLPQHWGQGRVITFGCQQPQNPGTERIPFRGHGYHDHNWGTLPFASEIQDWYWARATLGEGRSAVLYHVNYHRPASPVSHLLLFEKGRMTHHAPRATVQAKGFRVNAFGLRSATRLEVQSADVSVQFHLGKRLDSSPFYIRTLSQATLTQNGQTMTGRGMAEYFRPKLLGTKLAASATKARIVAP